MTDGPSTRRPRADAANRSPRLRFLDDRRGAVAVEYGLLAVVMGLAVFVAAMALDENIGAVWNDQILPKLKDVFGAAEAE